MKEWRPFSPDRGKVSLSDALICPSAASVTFKKKKKKKLCWNVASVSDRSDCLFAESSVTFRLAAPHHNKRPVAQH